MDALTSISLFTGYDGIGLALKRVEPGIRTVCYVEIEAFAGANLVSKIQAGLVDDAPVWSDIKTFDCSPWIGRVDIIHGGYPCQGFSAAGKRAGEEDPRYLWPWVRRAVSVIRPGRVFFENVSGHVSLGLREVLTDLVSLGYRLENSRGEPTFGIFSAAEVGAPHERNRVFILGELANRDRARRSQPKGSKRALGRRLINGGETMGNPEHDAGSSELRLESRERKAEGPPQDAMPRGSGELGDSTSGRAWTKEQPRQSHGHISTGSPIVGNPEGHGRGQGRTEPEGQQGRPDVAEPGAELANATGIGEREPNDQARAESRERSREDSSGRGYVVADANGTKRPLHRDDRGMGRQQESVTPWPARPGELQHDWEATRTVEPGLGRAASGNSTRVDRLRLCGNGVVPATAERAWIILNERLSH